MGLLVMRGRLGLWVALTLVVLGAGCFVTGLLLTVGVGWTLVVAGGLVCALGLWVVET